MRLALSRIDGRKAKVSRSHGHRTVLMDMRGRRRTTVQARLTLRVESGRRVGVKRALDLPTGRLSAPLRGPPSVSAA